MLDRTSQDQKARAAAIADRYIPATDREVAPTDNEPPIELSVSAESDAAAVKAYAEAAMASTPAIAAAKQQWPLLKKFVADNPVIQTAQEAQHAYGFIESTRKTLAAMDDERKAKVAPLNEATDIVNEPYRLARQAFEGTKQAKGLLPVAVDRWNVWEGAERARREAEAERVRQEAEAAARKAQELTDLANEALANAELGECTDAGGAIENAQAAVHDANALDRAATRAERATHIRVASQLGGKAGAPRKKRVIVIDDPCAAIKAIGLTEKITVAIRQSAEAFEEAYGELPAGTRATWERSV